ncbi:MAG: isoleucine--tRNA ligase [Clostridia bacterium]|nr:isoleucine--tRNA ligase [Clostridia bacterium]
MYKKVGELNLAKNEEEVLKFWQENNIKEKCLSHNKGKKLFSFYEGPPTANGQPHAGHVLTRTLKDLFNRYHLMQGYEVPRKGGWDTHGLPVEISVEKEIGISGKKQIEEYGVEKFVDACKKDVWKYVDLWKTFSDRVGYFVNMEDDCYITYKDEYIESVWWSLSELNKKGLLYKGYKVLPCCPSCGTALSSHEVAQGYKERNDLTVVAKFKSADEDNLYFLAWTTTPWTLPSNVALCVNPDEEYVKIQAGAEKYILAKALVVSFFKEDEYSVLETYKGKDLEYKKYVPLFDCIKEEDKQKAYFVTCDNYVTLTDGTGIVHIAPAYGADDANVGTKYNLPFVAMAGADGIFKPELKEYAGKNVFDVNEQVAVDLMKAGKIFKSAKHKHEYPHCWRCKSPLMYYAREGWFVKTTAFKDELIKNNQSVNWHPDTIKDGRMGNWLENVIDWNISRDRYWGTPLPVWTCECGHTHVVGSREELRTLGKLDSDIELHKPYVDNVVLYCPKCGKPMKREPYVIDCWYDSGSMPFAQFHYPFENKKEFERRFPADFIAEGADQCRGWFYTQLVLGTALFGKSPFKNVIVNGMVVDENGIKLSKSLQNYRPPMEIIGNVGADAVRWSFYTTTQPWFNQPMTVKTASETIKNYFGTLWNTYAFFVLYADIDKFNPKEYILKDCKLSCMDKWVLSKFNMLVLDVTKDVDEYKCTEPARKIQDFVDELSNWYVRRCRKRFWAGGMTDDKISAYETLWTVLVGLSKLTAPFTPFISESIYQNLVVNFFEDAPRSVHLADYPRANKEYIDEKLNTDMELCYKFTELGRSARNLSNIKIRQPLSKLYITDASGKFDLSYYLVAQIKEELNVKEVIENENLSKFVKYSIKPQLKTLGPKYGALLGAIRNYFATCNANEIVESVKGGNVYKFALNGTDIELSEDDILVSVEQTGEYTSATEDSMAVVLDTHLTQELIEEGTVREFVSKVQNLRKSSGYEVTDRIIIAVDGDADLTQTIVNNKDTILKDCLAKDLTVGTNGEFDDTFEYNDKTVKLYISR